MSDKLQQCTQTVRAGLESCDVTGAVVPPLHLSATYAFTSGRPYYNPNKPDEQFLKDRTIDYHSMGLQFNYLVDIGKAKTVFILNISNVLGSNQVYYYRFASKPDNSGLYRSAAVTPPAKRFIFIGAYISIGVDRRKDIIDN